MDANDYRTQLENFNDEDAFFDIGRVFRLILMQSKLVIALILVGSALSFANYYYTEKVFKVTSLVQVSKNTSQANPLSSLEYAIAGSSSTDSTNINVLYKSRSNITRLIEEYKLNLETQNSDISIDEISTFKYVGNKVFDTKNIELKMNKDTYAVSYDGKLFENNFYDLKNNIGEFEISILRPAISNERITIIEFTKPENLYHKINAKFQIESLNSSYIYRTSGDGLLKISYLTPQPQEGIKILNTANNLFIEQNIAVQSETARRGLNFINQSIAGVEEQLESDKRNLKEFQEKNKTINVDLEIEAIISGASEIESEISKTNLQISEASIKYTETNPLYVDLLNKRETLIEQKKLIDEKIRNLPLAQQEYVDLFMQLEISQKAFQELQNRKLELAIREASTLGNMRIIDNGYVDIIVEPKFTDLLFSLIMTFALAILIAILKGIYFIKISNPAELQDNGINVPIIGVIPKKDLLDSTDEEKFEQSMESLLVNIQTKINDLNITGTCSISITSSTPENGKSFISQTLAKKLASLGKKVLLLDNDFKRGDLHASFKTGKITKDEFFNLNNENIYKYEVSPNLVLIPKISKLDNSFQMLYSEKYINHVQSLKKNFDFVIIDTAPVLSVSDTSILLQLSDLSIAVVRHGVNKIGEIKQMFRVSDQIGNDYTGIVYNGYEKPSSYYGYYGLYGNYAYQYYAKKYLYKSYDYDEKN